MTAPKPEFLSEFPLPPLSRMQVRSVDEIAIERFGMSGLVLMENAGRNAAAVIDIETIGPVKILAGRGNNGGDGFVIARHLQLAGREVELFSVVPVESISGDARQNAKIAQASGFVITEIASPNALGQALADGDVIVDCLLGTGATGAPRGLYTDVIRHANRCDATRVAIDIPSGMDCDTGESFDPTFRAAHTITFVAEKIGFCSPSAREFLGKIWTVPIGVPKSLLESFLS